MKKINEIIKQVEYSIGTVMLITIVLLVFVSAILRVFNHPLVWSVDASQLLFIWISMIGADLALKNKSHMGVDLLVSHFPTKLQKWLSLAAYLLSLGFAIFIIFWGFKLCIQNFLRKYQTLRISYSFATAGVPTMAVCMVLTIAEQMGNLFSTWNDGEIK